MQSGEPSVSLEDFQLKFVSGYLPTWHSDEPNYPAAGYLGLYQLVSLGQDLGILGKGILGQESGSHCIYDSFS